MSVLILTAYAIIGVAFAIISTSYLKWETGPADSDLIDRITVLVIGLFAALSWPIAAPLALIALAWERADEHRERKRNR